MVSGTTGHKCQQSGIYHSACCKERIALSYNETFPPCTKCKGAATWVLVQST